MYKFKVSLTCLLLVVILQVNAQRMMENLDRGLVAVRNAEGKVFVSWRLLATEPKDISFNVYRSKENSSAIKLNKSPIIKTTNFLDESADSSSAYSYYVKPVVKAKETTASKAFNIKAGNFPYFSIPLQTPAGYSPNDGSVGDLDGDGEYEIVLHQTGRARDNSQAGITDPPI